MTPRDAAMLDGDLLRRLFQRCTGRSGQRRRRQRRRRTACDAGDPDDDNDGVEDAVDTDPLNAALCSDLDADGCDDCTNGTQHPGDDGNDFDGDGLCDAGDPDDDGDGVGDMADSDPLDPTRCSDLDVDGCDDCTSGSQDAGDDGDDFDADGLCDLGDPDGDNDGVDNASDEQPFNATACRDADADGCDDCTGGTDDPSNDGLDTDADGSCDAGDPDDDNDGVVDSLDAHPTDPRVCRDADADGCDDCSGGGDSPAADGYDSDADGLCDLGDPDDDDDGTPDVEDCAPRDADYSEPPPEVEDLRVARTASTSVSWSAQAGSMRYDVASGPLSGLRSTETGAGAVDCLGDDAELTSLVDSRSDPPPGEGYYYLARAQHACDGSYGPAGPEAQRTDPLACSVGSLIAFVTSVKLAGDLGGITGADALCNQLAGGSDLPGSYRAWLSDGFEGPSTTFIREEGYRYVRVDGEVIAQSWADLTDGALSAPINISESGMDAGFTSSRIWTGTTPAGLPTGANWCGGWTTTSGMGWRGRPTGTEFNWTQAGVGSCFVEHHLYCFQQP